MLLWEHLLKLWGSLLQCIIHFLRKGFADFAAKKGAKNDDFKTALKMAEWLRDDMKGDVQGKIK